MFDLFYCLFCSVADQPSSAVHQGMQARQYYPYPFSLPPVASTTSSSVDPSLLSQSALATGVTAGTLSGGSMLPGLTRSSIGPLSTGYSSGIAPTSRNASSTSRVSVSLSTTANASDPSASLGRGPYSFSSVSASAIIGTGTSIPQNVTSKSIPFKSGIFPTFTYSGFPGSFVGSSIGTGSISTTASLSQAATTGANVTTPTYDPSGSLTLSINSSTSSPFGNATKASFTTGPTGSGSSTTPLGGGYSPIPPFPILNSTAPSSVPFASDPFPTASTGGFLTGRYPFPTASTGSLPTGRYPFPTASTGSLLTGRYPFPTASTGSFLTGRSPFPTLHPPTYSIGISIIGTGTISTSPGVSQAATTTKGPSTTHSISANSTVSLLSESATIANSTSFSGPTVASAFPTPVYSTYGDPSASSVTTPSIFSASIYSGTITPTLTTLATSTSANDFGWEPSTAKWGGYNYRKHRHHQDKNSYGERPTNRAYVSSRFLSLSGEEIRLADMQSQGPNYENYIYARDHDDGNYAGRNYAFE